MDDQWPKSPPDLVERFGAVVAGIEELEMRQMFGYPAAFVGGNLTTSLHRDAWVVRLGEADREDRFADGWSGFEPMPGRPMRGYVTLPPDVAADPDAARAWVERAAAYVRGLPPKQRKPKKGRD
jgi:TfoX/Sxy family transcriptional regulator of competence genes